MPAGAAIAGLAAITGAELVSPDQPFGWLGAMILALLGAVTLWRAGSVKAWKETAEARAERLADLEREIGELRAELAIPERIQGIIALMGEQAVRQDAAAEVRLHAALATLERRWDNHDAAAEERARRLEELLARRGIT